VDQEDQGDHNPPWWTRTGFYILLMYQSHTSDTIAYMEHYLNQFRMKGIFLEVQVTKRTLAEVDEQQKEIQHQRTQISLAVAPSKWHQIRDDDGEEKHQRPMDLIYRDSHFNFIKVDLLSHFSDHIRQFGNIPRYSTEFGVLARKAKIKDGWRRSNKNDAACHIVHSYSHQQTIRLRLLSLKPLRHRGADLFADVLQHLVTTTSAATVLVFRRRLLKGGRDDVSDVLDFSNVSGVPLEIIYRKLIRYSRHNLPTERQLPTDDAILQLLPVELLTQLKIPVVAFQESDIYNIHHAQCTGALHFRNHGSRNDWVWDQAGSEEMYGALLGCLPAKLVALFKIRDYTCEIAVCWVAALQILSAVNSEFPSDIHSLVTVQMREDAREFTIVDVGTIHGLAHMIPEGERRWLINSRIDLRTFNKAYKGIGIGRGGGLAVLAYLVLARLCHNKSRCLANCGQVFLTSSPQFARRRFTHRQVVYV